MSLEEGSNSRNADGSRSIDCYACGFDYIHPEHDVPGSYGYKIYNHSCEELQKLGSFTSRFVRSCPIGVQNCFGSIGALKQGGSIYEKKIVLGCAESPYLHPYGCDTEEVFVKAKDRHNYTTQKVNVEVRMCFCSSYLCNTPQSMRLLSHSTSSGNLL
ncbi:uncharacterized protein [Lepeophtheirus salmonis]|uniref:uncharacterized protein n=1 Tax=Lepeophtheirus salmonis TaxID=72036 RepID=UPI003AF3C56B